MFAKVPGGQGIADKILIITTGESAIARAHLHAYN